MTQEQLKARLADLQRMVRAENIDADTLRPIAYATAAVELIGELLIDIKRMADAAEQPSQHFHPPEGSVLNAVGATVRIEPLVPEADDAAIARAADALNGWVEGGPATRKEAVRLVLSSISGKV